MRFGENGILEKWDYSKMRFWELGSLEKWDFVNIGFLEYEILGKGSLRMIELCENGIFEEMKLFENGMLWNWICGKRIYENIG